MPDKKTAQKKTAFLSGISFHFRLFHYSTAMGCSYFIKTLVNHIYNIFHIPPPNNFRMEFLAWDHCAVALFSARPSSKIPGFAMTHILLSRDIILGQ